MIFFFFFFNLTADSILVFPLDSGLKLDYYAGGEGGSTCNLIAKFCTN